MGIVTSLRTLSETVHVLVKTSAPTPEQLKAVYDALAQVTSDLTGDNCRIILKFDDPASQTTDGGSNGRDVE